jgi:hypothetical protein
MVQSEVHSENPKATIKSLPLELDFMIIEWLTLEDALNMAKALLIPEQVAVQYFSFDRCDIEDIYENNFYDIKPSSYKFLLKNTYFQVVATSNYKTWATIRTLDLDFVKKYIEEFKPDLDYALLVAADCGFINAVKLLVSDYGVDPSALDNSALIIASQEGHLEIAKLLLSDDRVDPSAQDNQALVYAFDNGRSDIVKLLQSHPRFTR